MAPKAHKLHPGFLHNVKIVSLIAVLAVMGTGLGFIAMRQQKVHPAQVNVPNIANISTQGGSPATETPHYTQALHRANQQGLAQARQANSTFIAALSDRVGYQRIDEQPPPLLQPNPNVQAMPNTPLENLHPNDPNDPNDYLANESVSPLTPLPAPSPGVAQQVQTLMATWDHPPQAQQVLGLQAQKSQTPGLQNGAVTPISTQQFVRQIPATLPTAKKQPIIKATDKYYAHLENGIDTDASSDVLAMLDQGPCQGAELMGSGQLKHQVVTATFTTLTCHGQAVSINAVALNDETLTNALPARIDHRYLQRIGVPALLGALGQAGSVYSHAGSTMMHHPLGGSTEITNPDPSLQQLAGAAAAGGIQAAQNVVQQQASALPPIRGRVKMNLPVLILFKSDVFL